MLNLLKVFWNLHLLPSCLYNKKVKEATEEEAMKEEIKIEAEKLKAGRGDRGEGGDKGG